MRKLPYFARNLIKLTGDRRGVVTIEFSFVIIIFIFFIFFAFEICRYMVISSAIDFSLSSAARRAAASSEHHVNYDTVFRDTIKKEAGSWAGLIDPTLLTTEVRFCDSITQAIGKSCGSASAGKMLAFYQVDYDYRPFLFSGVIPGTEALLDALRASLSRRLIHVQEYERDDIFKDD